MIAATRVVMVKPKPLHVRYNADRAALCVFGAFFTSIERKLNNSEVA